MTDVNDPKAAVVSSNDLRKAAPFSRHVWMRGRKFFKPLRQELLFAPANEITDRDLRIAKCVEMSAVFADVQYLDKICRRLSERFGSDVVLPHWMRAMVHLRRFDDAARCSADHATMRPDDCAAQLASAKYAMLAGQPQAALEIWRSQFGTALGAEMHDVHEIAAILIEAGEADWLTREFPAFAAENKVVARAAEFAPPTGDLPIYCMSLERDYRRMAGTSPFLSPGGKLTVVNALHGATLPQKAIEALVKGDATQITPAEIGCSLSHLAAWERAAAECDPDDYALIVEDDSRFIYGPGRGASEIVNVARAQNAGLVFVNLRACWEAHTLAPPGEIAIFPVGHRFDPKAPDVAPKNPGWGGDGYLISGATARMLADIWLEVGVLGAVDWQLNMMSQDSLRPWASQRITSNIYNVLSERGSWPRIPGYVCNMPIITFRDFAFSSINSGG